jgi:NTE family protein
VDPASSQLNNLSSEPDDTASLRVGVCLSGGGFRASLFGMGVLRYLAESGHLADVAAVSAVSGGSVTAAVLAESWPALEHEGFSARAFEQHVSGPFVEAVSERNLRNRGIARWALTRVTPRRRQLGGSLGVSMTRRLLRTRRVADLPKGLQVILTSTDLVSGRAFRVSRDFVGSWQFGYARTPPGLSLASALAASTAVPFLFPPVALRTDGLGLKDGTPAELALVDGGVYDNLGLEWFQGWDRGRPSAAREVDFVLVVDASGPLRTQGERYGWLGSLRRSQEVQYAQTRASRVRWFVEQLLDSKMQGLHIPIDRDPAAFVPPPGIPALAGAADGALPLGFASRLSGLRTDLDRFLAEEAALLMYHGYWSAHVRMSHIRPELACATPQWREFSSLSEGEQRRLHELLAAGARRSLHRR